MADEVKKIDTTRRDEELREAFEGWRKTASDNGNKGSGTSGTGQGDQEAFDALVDKVVSGNNSTRKK